MSTAATSLADILPNSVPKLEASGKNWAVFLLRFKDAVDAKGFWGHFDSSNPRPRLAIPVETPAPVAAAKPAALRSLLSELRPAASTAPTPATASTELWRVEYESYIRSDHDVPDEVPLVRWWGVRCSLSLNTLWVI